ncbi:hypothetical protein FB639_002321 [Coemansia asiatica]|nr:hypothetical protein FB639_002321 [Coemansia asiatica]
MIVSAIIFFVWADFMRIMLGIYEIVFGIWMILFELAEMAWLTPYMQFMFTWRGRGLFYVFIGCLTLGYKTLGWVFGAIITAIGVVYIVLSFTTMKNESYVSSAGSGNNTTNMYGSSGMYGSNKAGAMGAHSMYSDSVNVHYGAQTTYSGPVSDMQYGSQNTYSGNPNMHQYGGTQTTYTTRSSSDQQQHYQPSHPRNPTSPSQTHAPQTDYLHTPI